MAVTTITFSYTVDSLQATDIINTLATQMGYQATLPDGSANPQTQQQYVKQKIGEHLKQLYVQAKVQTALSITQQSTLNTAQTVSIT